MIMIRQIAGIAIMASPAAGVVGLSLAGVGLEGVAAPFLLVVASAALAVIGAHLAGDGYE